MNSPSASSMQAMMNSPNGPNNQAMYATTGNLGGLLP